MLFVLTFVAFTFALALKGEKAIHGDDNIVNRSRAEFASEIAPFVEQVKRDIGARADEISLSLFLRYAWRVVKAVARSILNRGGG